jgi:hypothetical protein
MSSESTEVRPHIEKASSEEWCGMKETSVSSEAIAYTAKLK